MKIFWSSLLCSVFISFTLFSCQPEADDLIIPDLEVNDSIYISKVVWMDTLFPSGFDTGQVSSFWYDGAKRVSHTQLAEYFLGVQQAKNIRDSYHFYQGADTIPFKVVSTVSDGNRIHNSDTSYLFYDAQGVVAKDSVIYAGDGGVWSRTLVRTFNRIADGHYRVDRKTTDADGSVTAGHTITRLTFANGNAVNVRDTSFYEDNSVSDISVELSSFDNNPSPFLRTKLRYPVDVYSHPHFSGIFKNNRIRWDSEWKVPGSSSPTRYMESYRYRYRADGYPLINFITDDFDSSKKEIYIYTKL